MQPPAAPPIDFDIQEELNQIEDLIIDSPRVFLTGKRLIDEDILIAQLDLVRVNLPEAFEKALAVLDSREQIIAEAETYAQNIVQAAQERAAQILDETGIIQQAELEAMQIRQQVQQECEAQQNQVYQECETRQRQVQQECETMQRQVQQECEALQRQTLAEVEQLRRSSQQELQQYRQQIVAECESIENGADQYAGNILNSLEQELTEMLTVVRKGKKQLYGNYPRANSPAKRV
jgi:F0F1-type ATP synthase membrane subunit b/b'